MSETTEQNYRIGTDSLPEWKVRAKTRGPMREKRLTVKTQTGASPIQTFEQAHKIAAEHLAKKISGPGATVEAVSIGEGKMDWRVYA